MTKAPIPESTPIVTPTPTTQPIPMNQPNRSFFHPHSRVHPPSGGPMMTVQSAKAECDINNILSQYRRTGILTHVTASRPTYEDLPSDLDYQASMNMLLEAQAAFQGLPAKVRDHFGNDPTRLLIALRDPDQADKLREFGILKPPPNPAASVVVTPTPASDPPAS